MTKIQFVMTLLMLAFALTACGAIPGTSITNNSGGPSQSNSNSSSSTNPAYAGSTQTAGPSAMQLAAGMIKLDGTTNAVTKQEATQLLPLWQSLQQIESTPVAISSPGATPQGTPGASFGRRDPAMMQKITDQIVIIQNAMTPAQIQVITEMNLNTQDIFTVFQQAGIQMGGPGQGSGFRQNGGTFTPPNGTSIAPGTPSAFQGGSGFGQVGRQGFGSFLPSTVVDGIVQYLQKKASS